MVDLLGQLGDVLQDQEGLLEGRHGGRVHHGGGVIPRFTELKDENGQTGLSRRRRVPHPRAQPPAGMHYTTEVLRKMCDIWEKPRLRA